MASQVDICNAALAKIAQDETIISMTDATKAAKAFNRVWDRMLDIVIAERSWPFAVTSLALAPDTEAPLPGWQYRYSRPNDCVTALMVCDASGVRAGISQVCAPSPSIITPYRVPFDTCYGSQSTSIVTDLESAYLIYVTRVADVTRWPTLAAEALTLRLAIEVAPTLAGELGLRMQQTLGSQYEYALMKAAAHGYNESRDDDPITPAQASRGD